MIYDNDSSGECRAVRDACTALDLIVEYRYTCNAIYLLLKYQTYSILSYDPPLPSVALVLETLRGTQTLWLRPREASGLFHI